MELNEIIQYVKTHDILRILDSKKNYVVFEEIPDGSIEVTFSNIIIVTTTLAKIPRTFHIFPNDVGMEDLVNSEIDRRNVEAYFALSCFLN